MAAERGKALMPRVFDCIMLNNELDMLECRLREFEHLPVTHCVVEATVDHRGHPKPLHYAEYRDRFAPWSDRIIHVIADDLPVTGNPWVTEHAQRDRTWQAVEDMARDSDVVLVSDVDEFPPLSVLKGTFPAAALLMKLNMYAVDWQTPSDHLCSVVASGRYMRGKQASAVRDCRGGYFTIQGGRHLTWLGGLTGQQEKLRVTCHSADDAAAGEMRSDEIERIRSGLCYRSGLHHAGDLQLLAVDVDETWPRWIYERKCPPSWFRPREAA